jgi:hypothetical protein
MTPNPYTPPSAALAEPAPKGRPGLVWAIAIYYGVATLGLIMSTVMIATNSLPMDPGTRAYYDSLTILDHVASNGIFVVFLAGIVLLFLMRTKAVLFLAAGLVLSIVNISYQLAIKKLGATLPGGGIGMLAGVLIMGAIVGYAYYLKEKGRLR